LLKPDWLIVLRHNKKNPAEHPILKYCIDDSFEKENKAKV
jgi:hypothetical protein